jgi:hypothetical protein
VRKVGLTFKADVACPTVKAVLATYAERFLIEVVTLDVSVAILDTLAFGIAELAAKEFFGC